MVFPISEPQLSKKQIEKGDRQHYVWYMRKLLDINFNEPKTLEDIGLKATLVEQVNQTLLNLWCGAPTLAQPYQDPAEETEESETGESETGESKPT
eukprot:3932390-Rhodomonas_salina.1